MPSELVDADNEPRPEHRALVAELRALGDNLRRQQLQPIVVYPGTNEVFPEARYLILVGHRR